MPVRLAATPHEKVWGSPLTEPWYRNPEGRKIGEVWFAAADSVPLLVKLLFTSESLSVQVHPDDVYARAHGGERGKTEMWHVLRAEEGARIGLGPREPLTPEGLRAASLTGEIERMLHWMTARAGDTFFAPAGTLHAIGGGLVLCEVQQYSDVTYRLYDYGRPRELHLDEAVAVARVEPYEGRVEALPVACPYFRTDRLVVNGAVQCPAVGRNTIYVAIEGDGTIAGEAFHAGEAWEIRAGDGPFEIVSERAVFLITAES